MRKQPWKEAGEKEGIFKKYIDPNSDRFLYCHGLVSGLGTAEDILYKTLFCDKIH